MSTRSRILSAVASLLIVMLMTSCGSVTVTKRTTGPGIGNGPPAHAAAHGYRKKSKESTTIVIEAGDKASVAYADE